MNVDQIIKIKAEIVDAGRLLWDTQLASGLNGNISARLKEDELVITATKTCLGRLTAQNVLHMHVDGQVLEVGKVSSENPLHTQVYKRFPQVRAVIHTHTPYINGFFSAKDVFDSSIFEAQLYLGKIRAVPQFTPTVTDIAPVLAALEANNIVVLQNHGVLAVGETLFDCFWLIQTLEESIKTEMIRLTFLSAVEQSSLGDQPENLPKHPLFSKEYFKALGQVLRTDRILQLLLKELKPLDVVWSVSDGHMNAGWRLTQEGVTCVDNALQGELVLEAPRNVWMLIAQGHMSPFAGIMQGKIKFKGDFVTLSKVFQPLNRIFALMVKIGVDQS